ncbi:MAG: hypothetical protein JXP34_15370 [Planctomycetes bacterium]|nr:hypothetical protein [Planctomycetota bacterium]
MQGFVLAIAYDAERATVTNVSVEDTATETFGADFIQPEILESENGFTLAVVLDRAGRTGNVIPPGDWTIAYVQIASDAPPLCGDAAIEVPLHFVDGVLNQPKLYNVIVIAGRSIRAVDGLVLQDGLFTIPPVCDRLLIQSTSVQGGPTSEADVPIYAQNSLPLAGFVLSIEHEPTAELRRISLEGTDTMAAGVEFHVANIYPTGGTLGVVLDFQAPFDGQTIPPADANGRHLATYTYALKGFSCPPDEPEAIVPVALRFADSAFGDPPLENILVEEGRSVSPQLQDGTLSFKVFCAPISFYIGRRGPGDGMTIDPAVGNPGSRVRLGLYYTSKNAQLQGLSMAICFDDRLTVDPDSFTIEDTMTEASQAEFVSWHVDNDPNDGDPKEMVVGILLDVLPPFDDQRYPPTPDDRPLEVAFFEADVAADAPCTGCLDIAFCDGANGAGSVPINNRAAVANMSVPPSLIPGQVCLEPRPEFRRGDCNWDDKIDLADPAATIGHIFTDTFESPCLDACDANDDGRLDLADSVFVLIYLFRNGSPPPAPGPHERGVDPTKDALGCVAGAVCAQ